MITTTITCDECGDDTKGYGATIKLVTSEKRSYWPIGEPIRYGGKAPERFETITRENHYCANCLITVINTSAIKEIVRLHNNPFPNVKMPQITREQLKEALQQKPFICNGCAADEEGECTEEGCVNYKPSGVTWQNGRPVPSCALGDESGNGTMYGGWGKE